MQSADIVISSILYQIAILHQHGYQQLDSYFINTDYVFYNTVPLLLSPGCYTSHLQSTMITSRELHIHIDICSIESCFIHTDISSRPIIATSILLSTLDSYFIHIETTVVASLCTGIAILHTDISI